MIRHIWEKLLVSYYSPCGPWTSSLNKACPRPIESRTCFSKIMVLCALFKAPIQVHEPSLPCQWDTDMEQSLGHFWLGISPRLGGRNGNSMTKITSSVHHMSQAEHVISRLAILIVWFPEPQKSPRKLLEIQTLTPSQTALETQRGGVSNHLTFNQISGWSSDSY